MIPFIEKNFYNSGPELWYRHVGSDYFIGKFQCGRSPISKTQAIRLLIAHYDVNSFILRTKKREKLFAMLEKDGYL